MMYAGSNQIWILLAMGTSLVTGFFFALTVKDILKKRALAKKVRMSFLDTKEQEYNDAKLSTKGFTDIVLGILIEQSRALGMRSGTKYFIQGFWKLGLKKYPLLVKKSGLENRINIEGFCHARALFALGGGFVAACVGAVFSNELAIIALLGGFFSGWKLPLWSLRQESKTRKNELENHLSEMLEVVALGLRSGLSFDRAFELYHLHFPSKLAYESSVAQRQWQIGLKTREESLRELVSTYDSAVFSRVIENVIRSLRFGSSLADSFDSSALEARLLRKARREEEVAKAPVKMLIPTAALILPAMLMLVLGPILLDMIQGF